MSALLMLAGSPPRVAAVEFHDVSTSERFEVAMKLDWTLTMKPAAAGAGLKLPFPATEPPEGLHSMHWGGRRLERATWSTPTGSRTWPARPAPLTKGVRRQPGDGEVVTFHVPRELAGAPKVMLSLTLVDSVWASLDAAPRDIPPQKSPTQLGQVRSDTLSDAYTQALVRDYQARLTSGVLTARQLIEELVARLQVLPQVVSRPIRPADVVWRGVKLLEDTLGHTPPEARPALTKALARNIGVDCDDRAMAMVALLTALGIESRQVTVVVNPATDGVCNWEIDPADLGQSVLHAIVEYRGPCGWEQCDPTCGTVGFVSHLFRLASSVNGNDLLPGTTLGSEMTSRLALTSFPLGSHPHSELSREHPLRRRKLRVGDCTDARFKISSERKTD